VDGVVHKISGKPKKENQSQGTSRGRGRGGRINGRNEQDYAEISDDAQSLGRMEEEEDEEKSKLAKRLVFKKNYII